MAAPAVEVIEDGIEEYFSADEAGNASPPPRDFHTPLPPDVMEELAQITNKLVKFKEKRNPEVEDALQLFIQEWRSQTEHEIDELKKLKEHVSIRKSQRAEEEALLAEMRREEEEMKIRMAEEERIRKHEEKLKRLADAELKRQKLMEEQSKGRNFKIAATVKEEQVEQQDSSRELSKEEFEARKTAALSVIIKPLELGGLQKERLKKKANELWEQLVKLETDRYDLEEKRTRQEYDFKELKERQKQQLRQKALKLGLDPEALTGRYPPKIRVASKYERRKELRPFGETKDLFEGGFIKEGNRKIDDAWHKRQEVFTKRNPDELPPWLADMPRQTIKQMEEDEAIKAVITKEEVEGKQPPSDDEVENENEAVHEEQELAENEDAEEDDGGVERKEIVITDGSEAASEGQEEDEEEIAEEDEDVADEEAEVESVAATEEEVISQHTAEEEEEEEELADEDVEEEEED